MPKDIFESYVEQRKRKSAGSIERKKKREEIAKKVSSMGILGELNKKK
ncbi:MAG TPA: hypothetical protein VMZ04_04875 [Anaerolineae bacterium]|nr:hypothetical protein [Anaerolineae bacterium]